MILKSNRIIVGDAAAGIEPGTTAPEVWCATNEHHISIKQSYIVSRR